MTGVRFAPALARSAYAVAIVGATVAPALAFDAATVRGGAPRSSGDLVVASSVVGIPYAALMLRRLASARTPRERTDLWLSSVHGVVVLWLAASALPAAALHSTAGLHARAADAEWPLLVGWSLTMVLAALLAEGGRAVSLRWLRRPDRDAYLQVR